MKQVIDSYIFIINTHKHINNKICWYMHLMIFKLLYVKDRMRGTHYYTTILFNPKSR